MARDTANAAVKVPSLERQFLDIRAVKSLLLTALTWLIAILASVPLISVIYMLVVQGGARLDWEALSEIPPAGFETGGGFGNAIAGTLVMVGISTLISVPVGILAALYLAILGPQSKIARIARFLAKVLTGFPSILAGVFAYATVVLFMGPIRPGRVVLHWLC
jgi:phosphate transport system permease protein